MNPSKYSVGPASIHRSTVAPAGGATKSLASGTVGATTSSPLKEAIREHVRKLASPKSEHEAPAPSEAVMVKESGPIRGWHLEFVKMDDLAGFGASPKQEHPKES